MLGVEMITDLELREELQRMEEENARLRAENLEMGRMIEDR